MQRLSFSAVSFGGNGVYVCEEEQAEQMDTEWECLVWLKEVAIGQTDPEAKAVV